MKHLHFSVLEYFDLKMLSNEVKTMIIMILNRSKSVSEQVPSAPNEDRFPTLSIQQYNYQAYSSIYFSTYSPVKISLDFHLPGAADLQVKIFVYFITYPSSPAFFISNLTGFLCFFHFFHKAQEPFPFIFHTLNPLQTLVAAHLLSFSPLVS